MDDMITFSGKPDALRSKLSAARTNVIATVLLPVHNASAHVTAAVDKMNRLVGGKLEFVIVDDGSTDDTWSLLTGSTFNAPTTLIRIEENVGVARARNLALYAASGEYVWMIDGDDDWPSDALQTLVNAATTTSADMVVANAEKVIVATGERVSVTVPSRTGSYEREGILRELLAGGLRGHLWNKLFRRDVLGDDPFPVLRSKSDYCMVIELIPRLERMHVIAEQVYEYRYQMGSITNSKIATPLDLLRCYESAMRVAACVIPSALNGSEAAAFRYFSIAQIAYSEIWRYGPNAINGTTAAEYLRGMLTLRGLFLLAGSVSLQRLITAAGLKFAPRLLGRLYRSRRSRRWSVS